MAAIAKALGDHTLVGLDTSVFIYHFEAHPDYLPLTQAVFAGIERGRWHGVSSVVTFMELAVRPYQLGHEHLARQVEALLIHFPNMQWIEISRSVAHQAARLRAEYRLRPPDALQTAACLQAGASVFVTNDRQLERLAPILRVLILDDFR